MKFKIAASVISSVLVTMSVALCAASAAGSHNPVVVVPLNQLDAGLAAQISAAQNPVVLEFYDAQDPDVSGECKRQLAESVNRFAGQVTMLRAEVHAQSADMIQSARIAVCPTHLFVRETNANTIVANRVWGYLDESQFKELFKEFFGL
jgi:hypothetical protein